MNRVGIIGGSGFTQLSGFSGTPHRVETFWGEPSARIVLGDWQRVPIAFLARHGTPHRLAPHLVNYRANLWALKQQGVRALISIATAGGIAPECGAGVLAVPDQIIDYTWGRDHTFFDHPGEAVRHVDFSRPYCEELRALLIGAARQEGIVVRERGVYAATQGPRFESAAEIDRLARDGAELVGMTGMPEAALARELELCYAALVVVVNPAAGRGEITAGEIRRCFEHASADVLRIVGRAVRECASLSYASPVWVDP
jgi:5'-methylthioinosine phosphorylase